MNLQFLSYFVQVAETQSFSKAAENACLSQPALSKAIGALEKEFGCSLFNRGTKLRLTSEGETLLKHCRKLFPYLDQIHREIAQKANQSKQTLRFALPRVLIQEYFPPVLAEFHRKHPAMSLELSEEDNADIETQVMEGNVDFGVLSREPQSLNIKTIKLGSFPFILVGPDNSKKTLTEELSSLPLIVRSPCQLEAIQQETDFFSRFPQTRTIMPINCYYTLRNFVENGLGIAFIPSFLKTAKLRSLATYPGMRMDPIFVFKKGWHPSSFQQTFLKFIKAFAEAETKKT